MKQRNSQRCLLAAIMIGLGAEAVCRAEILPFDIPQPVIIPETGTSRLVLNSLPGPAMAGINSVQVTMTHHWLGDLTVKVITPAGAEFILFDHIGQDDDGSPALLGITLPTSDPANGFFFLDPAPYRFAMVGVDFPAEAQSAVDNETWVLDPSKIYAAQSWLPGPFPAGTWQVIVADSVDEDGGEITGAQIDYASSTTSPKTSVDLAWNFPSEIVYGTVLGPAQLNATASANGVPVPGVFTYLPGAGTILPVGNSQALSVLFTPRDQATYAPVTANLPINVKPAPLIVVPDNQTKTYGANVPTLTATYSGFVNGDSVGSITQPVTLATPANTSSPVGTYPITATGGVIPNYTLILNNGTLNVTPAALVISAENKTMIYGGPLPSFTASFSGFVNGDTATSLSQPVTFASSASASSPAGTYPIFVMGGASPNYTLILNNGTLTIAKTDLIVTVTAENKTKVYGAALPSFTASYSGFANGDSAATLTAPVTFATTATQNSPVGTYPIRVSGGASSKYTLVFQDGTLTVTPATLVITADDKTKVYGAALPAFTASYSGFVNGDSAATLTTPVTLATTATGNSPVGTYPIRVSGGASSKYTLVFQDGTLLVAPAVLTVTADDQTKVYGAPLPALTATYQGFVNGDTPSSLTVPITLSTAVDARTAVGQYQIRASGGANPNYTLVLNNGSLTVTKAPLTVSVNNASKAYGAPLPIFTASYTGFVNGDTAASFNPAVTFGTTATASSVAGTYPITITGGANPNYELTMHGGTLTVTGATLVITAENKSMVYGSAPPELTASYSGFLNGDTPASLSQRVTLTTPAKASSPVGTYPITVAGGTSSKYTVILNSGALTITKAPLTVTADDKTKAYGAVLPDFTASYDGFVNGDTASALSQPVTFATTATVNSPVGVYPITITGGSSQNYSLSLTDGTLLVARAALSVTADDQSKVYGAPLPPFTATFQGFVNGDTELSLIEPVKLTTTVDAHSPVGQYQIRASGGAASNYMLLLNNGILTVTKAPLTIAADNASKPAGAPLPPFTATYTGFVNGDTPASLIPRATLSTLAIASSPPGSYPIKISGAQSANYDISLVNGTLTVTQTDLAPKFDSIAPNVAGDGSLGLTVIAAVGTKARLEWSEDMQTWTALATQTSYNGEIHFQVAGLDGVPMRFFRAVLVVK